MKKWQKVTASVLVLSAALTLAACGNAKKAEKTADGDKIEIPKDKSVGAMVDFKAGEQFKATKAFTVDVLYREHPNYPWDDNWLFNTKLKEMTNVSFAPVITPMSDLEQKRSLMISSGDAPTLMTNVYAGQESQFVASGQILAISDYIDYMPNFKAAIKEWQLEPDLERIRQVDGKFYNLPMVFEEPCPEASIAIRKDIFEKEGIPIPETWEDIYQALKTLKAKYPDNYLFSDRWVAGKTLELAAVEYGSSAGNGYNPQNFDKSADKFVYNGASDNYKEVVTFFAKLVSEGLMDKESFTQDDPQAIQKFVNGQSFVISTNPQEMTSMIETMDETLGKGNFEVMRLLIPGGPNGRINGTGRLSNGFMVSSKIKESPNFKATLQFIDWLIFSEEGQLFARWGVEGETYTTEGDIKNGGKINLAKDVNTRGLNPTGTKDLQKDFGFGNGAFAFGNAAYLVNSIYNDTDRKWLEEMATDSVSLEAMPPAPMADLEAEELAIINTNLKDTVDQETLKFILGQRPLSDWDNFIKQLKDKGLENWETTTNKAYQDYKEKFGE
ncbi:sugar ABC transporter substrate-binding protein [Lactococcus hodotermopsidis]|uniref:Sugar ABC transporter substrate-binding protein n=1 Tax=Pseudolactococcus hodotermopsidis TaxID=2709157 RepID=A0A6A0BBD4_9LACT|nr:extracellular solute-binding protein [Lactococcus hodotermopsidis]GFH42680.1 sugar ABC transporter substrate-binding protein [Lactococcus hodotermopsidis]